MRKESSISNPNYLRKLKVKAKEALFLFGEKSPYLTLPVTGVIFVASLVSGSAVGMALSATAAGIDIWQNKHFGKKRENLKRNPEVQIFP